MAIINCYDVNGDAIRFLTQWDHDISIRATGVKTSPIPEFRFSNKNSQKSRCISGVVVGDGVKATIPNGFLQEALPIYVQLFYTYPSGDAKTEHTFVIPVKPASMPDGAVYEPVEVRSIVELEERVKALEENGNCECGPVYVAGEEPPDDVGALWVDTTPPGEAVALGVTAVETDEGVDLYCTDELGTVKVTVRHGKDFRQNQTYVLPVGGDELGGVKNGGNVIINADGTMTAPDNKPTDEQVGSAVSDYLDEHPEATTTVADGSITPQKTTFITPKADNLIDVAKMVKGNQGANGVPAGSSPSGAGWTTDLIPVEPGKKYNSVGGHGTSGMWSSWFYDSGKNPVAVADQNPFVAPDGAAYVRLTFLSESSTWGLYEGENPRLFTQGVQRYELDTMLSEAVRSVCASIPAVFKVSPENLYKYVGKGGVNASTGRISYNYNDSGMCVSDYIPIVPNQQYTTNCFDTVGYTACYDADRNFVASLENASERTTFGQGGKQYVRFRITDPNVRYIVTATSASYAVDTLFIVPGSEVPESLDGTTVVTDDPSLIEAVKALLWESGDALRGLKWAVLGDSITSGEGRSRTYHSIVAAKLGIDAINYGIAGTSVAVNSVMGPGTEMSTRYAQMDADAGIITVFGGTNDINREVPVGAMGDTTNTTFYGAMDVLLRGLLHKYPGRRIGFITPLNYGEDEMAKPYIDAIHAVCGKYAVPVLDLYREGMISTVTEELSAMYFADGLHPNDAGHDVIARKVEAFLRTL